jgi:uncharacterized protein YwqG
VKNLADHCLPHFAVHLLTRLKALYGGFMFDSPQAASEALLAWFDRPRIEIIVEALVPAIVLHPSAGHIVIGASQLGGTPHASVDFKWPRPQKPDDPEEIAKRGNADAAQEMREHMAQGLPYAFMAQIDLAEAAKLGPVAVSLPSEGRLLFFYDIAIGPWETGMRPAKVIWDRTPIDRLAVLSVPDDLAAAQVKAREEAAALEAEFGTPGEASSKEQGTNYGAPARAVSLEATYRLPNPAALEFDRLGDFSRAQPAGKESEDALAAYEEALQATHDQYPQEGWRRQQLLGSPMPEQDDPRLDAVVVSEFGKQHLSREDWVKHRAAIFEKARDWTLLLQVDLADWMQAPYVEGTVFFVIRRDDLDNRHFDKVIAVYQQT